MLSYRSYIGACLFFIVSANASFAAPITRTYDFFASGFTGAFFPMNTAPFDPVSGSFTVTFDPLAGDVTDETSGISGSPGVPVASSLAFSYDFAQDKLIIGGASAGAFGISPNGSEDFFLLISGASTTSPSFDGYHYSTPILPDFYFTLSGTVSLVAVEEPAILALFFLGLAGLGFARRHHCRRAGFSLVFNRQKT